MTERQIFASRSTGKVNDCENNSNHEQTIVDHTAAIISLRRSSFLILALWFVAALLYLAKRGDHPMVLTDRVIAMLAIFNFCFATGDTFVRIFFSPHFHLEYLLVMIHHERLLNAFLTVEFHFNPILILILISININIIYFFLKF